MTEVIFICINYWYGNWAHTASGLGSWMQDFKLLSLSFPTPTLSQELTQSLSMGSNHPCQRYPWSRMLWLDILGCNFFTANRFRKAISRERTFPPSPSVHTGKTSTMIFCIKLEHHDNSNQTTRNFCTL